MFNSPLRYPGGKNKLAKFIAHVCKNNNVAGHYIEPYVGGASISLYLLFNGYVEKITMNDLDRSIYAFWHSILNHTKKFCKYIDETDITIKNWKNLREIQMNKKTANLFDLGFSTFFLNRTNYSGIIEGGVIGGVKQNGSYKIDCRFNKPKLIKKIEMIKKYKNKIELFNLDALELIQNIQKKSMNDNVIFYFDPPYYLKGPSLYMNHYVQDDHKEVAKKIKKIKYAKWIVSYDNMYEIKNLYKGCRKKEYSFFHTANHIHQAKEILFFSNNLKIPHITNPMKIRA